jgi:hypothetical protein
LVKKKLRNNLKQELLLEIKQENILGIKFNLSLKKSKEIKEKLKKEREIIESILETLDWIKRTL